MSLLLLFFIILYAYVSLFIGLIPTIQKMQTLVDKLAFTVDKRLEAMEVSISELKSLVIQTKTREEQGEILTFTDLLKKYDIKRKINVNHELIDAIAYTKPIFDNLISFETFENEFMTDENFSEDLQ